MSSVFLRPSRINLICRLKRCIRSWLPRTFSAFSLSINSAWQTSQLKVPIMKLITLSASRGEKDLLHWGHMYPLLSSSCKVWGVRLREASRGTHWHFARQSSKRFVDAFRPYAISLHCRNVGSLYSSIDNWPSAVTLLSARSADGLGPFKANNSG